MVSTRQSSNMGSHSARVSEHVDTGPSSRRNHTQSQMSTAQSTPEPSPVRHLNLMDLPPEIMRKIGSYLDYNTIAHLRPVRLTDLFIIIQDNLMLPYHFSLY